MTLTDRRPYVEQREDEWFVAGTRVSLDSVVTAYLEGFSAEQIRDSFPVLTLEQIHGTLAFYLAHQDAVDAHLREKAEWFEAERLRKRAEEPEFHARLLAARDRRTGVKDTVL